MDSKISNKQKSFFDIKKDLNKLAADYPFINLKVLSRSALGREIYSVSIGKAEEYVYFIPAFSGCDTLMPVLLLKFLEELSFSLYSGTEIAGVNIRKATGGKGIVFLPLINPDGHEIAIKGYSAASYLCNTVSKNAECEHTAFTYNLRGVYLENNFYKWTVGTPYKNSFGGYSPFSEPESLSVAEHLRRFTPRHIVGFNERNDFLGIYSPEGTNRTKKMAEVVRAVYTKEQRLMENGPSFYNWVKTEFTAPSFNIGLKGINENNLNKYYAELKELLVLMLIM